jgi:hypothetical protein
MIAKAFDDAWAQLGDEADPAMASLVRTALAKRIIETASALASIPKSCGMTPLRMSKTIRLAHSFVVRHQAGGASLTPT